MSYRYTTPETFANTNMIDIDGPDGRLSCEDVLLLIAQRAWLRQLVFLTIPATTDHAPTRLTEAQAAALRRCVELGALDDQIGLDDPDDIIDERTDAERVYDGDTLWEGQEA